MNNFFATEQTEDRLTISGTHCLASTLLAHVQRLDWPVQYSIGSEDALDIHVQ